MCGIAGVLDRDLRRPDEGLFGRMGQVFYRAVRKLPPAHDPVFREGRALPAQGVEAKAITRQLFLDAVKKRRVADVPLGVFLSGGIDSTLVVGAMTMQSSAPDTSGVSDLGFHLGYLWMLDLWLAREAAAS